MLIIGYCDIITILIIPMKKLSILLLLALFLASPTVVLAQKKVSPSPIVSSSPSPVPISDLDAPRVDITQKTEEAIGPLEKLLREQKVGKVMPFNPIKYAIRGAVASGVPANTIVLLLLLPIMALIIAFTRNVIGIRGFGIFLPAALATTFVATGPLLGIGLFLVIVSVSTVFRMVLRRLKIKLQYLPRMAFILWAVCLGVLGILFMAPLFNSFALANVSIFAVLILILLSEDFTRVQLGKSINTALSLTMETLILATISYFFLTLKPLQNYVLLNPEITIIGVGLLDYLLAKYSGLRLMEMWRFRKLIKS